MSGPTHTAVMGELHAWLTNALEDQRMEWLTGQHYGAARADFAALAALLWQKKPLSPLHRSSREGRLLNACLFWRAYLTVRPVLPVRST